MVNMAYLIPLIAAVGPACLSRRLMGGLIGKWFPWWPGTQAARLLWGTLLLIWAILVQLTVGSAAPWWVLAALGYSWPVGSALIANGGMSLRNWQDHLQIAGHGTAMAVIAAIATYAWTGGILLPMLVMLAGLATLPAYMAAWAKPLEIPALDCLRVDPPPTAEVYIGIIQTAVIAAVLILA